MQRIHSDDSVIESQIQTNGLTAPRVTPTDIAEAIVSEYYFTAFDGIYGVGQKTGDGIPVGALQGPSLSHLTFCVLVLRNGFTVTGESACASPENFDAQIGRDIARQNAVNKIWPLLGYQLKDELHRKAQCGAEVGGLPG